MYHIPYGKQLIEEDDINAVVEALKSPLITTGPKAKEFEEQLACYTGAKYAVVVSNGTAALHLTSLALLKEGDKVLTTPNSFLATSNTILYAKAKPVFVDIMSNGNIDLDLCEKALQQDSTIKAIYAVAFSGNPVDQDKLAYLRNKYQIKVVEDCAHAIGSQFKGIKAGSCTNSDCTIFSFHPVKHMTTGEGGAITTNDELIYKKLLLLRNHGMERMREVSPWYYEMNTLGFNYRITDFQCALGMSQLAKLDANIARRHEIAKKYDEAFENHPIIKPLYKFDGKSSYHLYVIQLNIDSMKISKKEFFDLLIKKGIGTMVHYIPINKQPYYKSLGFGNEKIPVMDQYYEKTLSLPMYHSLNDDEQRYIINVVNEILEKSNK